MAGALSGDGQNKVSLKFSSIAQPVNLSGEGGSLEGCTWLVARSCGYASEDEARMYGERFRSAMQLAGAFNRFGVDCGHDKRTLHLSKDITDKIKEAQGVEMRSSVHGLDIFQEDKVSHFSMEAKGSVIKTADRFRSEIEDVLASADDLTDR